jgi:hypothetical protein
MTNPLHSPRQPARRTKRGLALLCALVLVTSNALAALGVCVAKTPPAGLSAQVASAESAPCPQHDADAVGNPASGERAAATHCPQDDPSAQPRAADLPVGDWVAAPSCARLDIAPRVIVAARAAYLDYAPPELLYERLSRLLL